jgi:hypothetical protein
VTATRDERDAYSGVLSRLLGEVANAGRIRAKAELEAEARASDDMAALARLEREVGTIRRALRELRSTLGEDAVPLSSAPVDGQQVAGFDVMFAELEIRRAAAEEAMAGLSAAKRADAAREADRLVAVEQARQDAERTVQAVEAQRLAQEAHRAQDEHRTQVEAEAEGRRRLEREQAARRRDEAQARVRTATTLRSLVEEDAAVGRSRVRIAIVAGAIIAIIVSTMSDVTLGRLLVDLGRSSASLVGLGGPLVLGLAVALVMRGMAGESVNPTKTGRGVHWRMPLLLAFGVAAGCASTTVALVAVGLHGAENSGVGGALIATAVSVVAVVAAGLRLALARRASPAAAEPEGAR